MPSPGWRASSPPSRSAPASGHLVDTPAAYGFNWQLSPDLFEDEPERLAERSEVEDLGLLLFRQTIIEGEDLDGLAVVPVKGNPSLTVLDGRMPTTPGEVALGPKTMDRPRRRHR